MIADMEDKPITKEQAEKEKWDRYVEGVTKIVEAVDAIKKTCTPAQKRKLKHGKCPCNSGKKFFKCCWKLTIPKEKTNVRKFAN